MTSTRKSGRWTWLLILIFLLVLITAIMSTFGLHLFEKTEEVKILENPHGSFMPPLPANDEIRIS